MSEQLLLLNPRRKRRKSRRMPAGLARYWATHRRRATNPRRRRRRARLASGKRRRVHHVFARQYNPRRRRRSVRRYRAHNPRRARRFGGGVSARGMIKGYVVPATIGGIGTLLLDVVYGYVQPQLPAQLQAGWMGVAGKLGVILLSGWALNRFVPRLRHQTQVAVLGATTVLAYGAIKQAVGSMLPASTAIPGLSGVGAYPDFQRLPVGVGAYMPRAGMGAYMPRNLGDYYSPAAVLGAPAQPFNGLGRLGSHQPHTAGAGGGVAGFDYMNDGM